MGRDALGGQVRPSYTRAHATAYFNCDSRSKLNRPFTLAEKIIYSHLSDAKSQEIVRGKVRHTHTHTPHRLMPLCLSEVRDYA